MKITSNVGRGTIYKYMGLINLEICWSWNKFENCSCLSIRERKAAQLQYCVTKCLPHAFLIYLGRFWAGYFWGNGQRSSGMPVLLLLCLAGAPLGCLRSSGRWYAVGSKQWLVTHWRMGRATSLEGGISMPVSQEEFLSILQPSLFREDSFEGETPGYLFNCLSHSIYLLFQLGLIGWAHAKSLSLNATNP